MPERCVATYWSDCPCWPLSTDKGTYNIHGIKIGPWGNGKRWWKKSVRALLPCGRDGTRMQNGKTRRRQRLCDTCSVMHSCGCYLDTHTTSLNIGADQLHPFMAISFPNGSNILQSKLFQEWLKEHEKELKVLSWHPNSEDLNPFESLMW